MESDEGKSAVSWSPLPTMPRSWFRHGMAAGKSAAESEAAFPLGGCKSTNYYTSGFATIQAVIDNIWLQARCIAC